MRREATYGRSYGTIKTNYYVDGNTVRRLEGEPEERRRRQLEKEREQRRRESRHVAKKNQEKALSMGMGYVVFCALAVVLTCAVCVIYIQLQSDITSRMKNISRLESQVTDMRADNDAAIKRIDLSTDLEAVKKTAMTQLGMTYASDDQIIYYSVDDSDYMNQYADIPGK